MKIKLLIVLVLCAVLLAGCGCEHAWKDATCTAPKTCTLCSEVEGEALGHTWADATCETAKICSACGATEGEALGHTWADATCAAPKTCSACNATEGETLEHTFGEWAVIDGENEERTCTACGYAEKQTIDRLAMLMELLGVSRWYCAYIMIGEDVYEASEYEDDYVFVSRLLDDGSFVIGGIYGGGYFDEGALELIMYDFEDDTYAFVNEKYPSYLYWMTGNGETFYTARINDDSTVDFYVIYQQHYRTPLDEYGK